MERESSKECSVSFLWTNKSFSLWNCLSRNSTLFSTRRIGALGLFWTNQGSEVSEDTWGTFRTLWSKESTFWKRNFCIYKGFMDVFYIWHRRERKTTKCACALIFAMCSTDLRELLFRITFLNKNFQEFKLFICRCSFITLAQKRPWDYRSWDF